jgi:hypothetical protein
MPTPNKNAPMRANIIKLNKLFCFSKNEKQENGAKEEREKSTPPKKANDKWYSFVMRQSHSVFNLSDIKAKMPLPVTEEFHYHYPSYFV